MQQLHSTDSKNMASMRLSVALLSIIIIIMVLLFVFMVSQSQIGRPNVLISINNDALRKYEIDKIESEPNNRRMSVFLINSDNE